MKKIIKKWKRFLNEAQHERGAGRPPRNPHDRSLTGAEQIQKTGDVRAMFRNELDQTLITSYRHQTKPSGFRRMRKFLLTVANYKREWLLNDLIHIIEIYQKDEQEKVKAGGWPMWVKTRTGEIETRYSAWRDEEYEAPVYQTRYLGPSEEPSSVFNGQPIQVANEDFKMIVLEQTKKLLENEIALAQRRSKTVRRASPADFKDKDWVRSFYGLNVWRPEDIPDQEPEPDKPTRDWSYATKFFENPPEQR